MKKEFLLLISVLLCRKIHGHEYIADDDDFGLDTVFQENFHIHDEIDNVPIPLGQDENGCVCKEVPNKLGICFGLSRCYKVPHSFNITTPGMKLTTTHIAKLRPGDFEGYYHLQNLQIEGNLFLVEILPGTFNSNFSNLKNLSISYNSELKTLHTTTFDGLTKLSHLFLLKNGFQHVAELTPAFAPKFLPSLYRLSLCQNNLFRIDADDFSPMLNSPVEMLTLVVCRLEVIAPKAFVPLKNLRILRLGENRFNVSTITAVIEQIAEHRIPLFLLNLYSAGMRNTIPRELMEAIAKTNISDLNLAGNKFESIRSDSFPLMPKIQILDLREVLASDISPDAFTNLTNLKTLLLSGNNLPAILPGVLVPTLRNLDIQQNSGGTFGKAYFFLCDRCFSNVTKLMYLNLNFNTIHQLIRGNFEGLSRLRVLSIKNSSIFQIQNFTFKSQRNLVFLNLENNDFVRRNLPYGIWPDMFFGLENLRVLLLGSCSISYFSLYGSPFVHLKSLIHLGLQNNDISVISPTDFAPLTNLQSIDLSRNFLRVWDERIFFCNQLLRVVLLHHNKLTYISETMLSEFSNLSVVKLRFNSLTCDCLSFSYIPNWTEKNEDSKVLEALDHEAHCIYPTQFSNYTIVEFIKNVQNNTINCDMEVAPRLIIMLPLVLLILFFLALTTFVYFYRWHLKYWIFLSRLYLSRKGKIRPKKKLVGINNYVYDAFISYSTEDRNFVLRLASMLEHYEPYLKLCIYERDFQIGAFLSECILEGVAKSRKTVLIISDNYAKSQWCRWESHLAEHHRLFFENEEGEYVDDSLILVKLGPVSSNHLTPILKYLLKTRIYLQWEADEKKQKIFWEKLRSALLPPHSKGKIIELTHM